MINAQVSTEAPTYRGDADDITVEVGDLVCVSTATRGIAYYGMVKKLLPGNRALLINRAVGQRRVSLDDIDLVLKAGALNLSANSAKSNAR